MIKKSILSGICIALGGAVNLIVGGPLGAFLFAFGLLSVIYYSIPLYTGRAGFFKNKKEFLDLFIILFGNIIGCLIVGLLLLSSDVDGGNILFSRIESGYINCLCGGILCGIVMSLAVRAKDQPLLTLLGIPLFIMSKYFYHSIADIFYATCTIDDFNLIIDYLPYWGTTVIGNFIGCNIPTRLYHEFFIDVPKV